MKVRFHIDYRTTWGESVYITGSAPCLGAGDPAKAVKMTLTGDQSWHAAIDIADDQFPLAYSYLMRADDGRTRSEWGHQRQMLQPVDTDSCDVYDAWQDQPHDKPYYASAFTECICRHDGCNPPMAAQGGRTLLSVAAPMVAPNDVLAVVGQTDVLGKWDPAHAIVMDCANFPIWTASIPSDGLTADTEYKFVILNAADHSVVSWEGNDNRRLGITPSKEAATIVAGMRFVNFQPLWKGAGVAIPVFALRSADDFGVGDFMDLKLMVDWAVATHQRFIQLLPINDTTMTHTWTDSYPYNANSCFALHPMYMRLSELGELADPERRKYYRNIAAELNALPQVDYERVNQGKIEYFREIYAQEGRKVVRTAAFKAFVKANEHWLKPYAAFCMLRDRFGTPDFSQWGEYATYDKKKVDALVKANTSEINYVYFLQYNLDKQMRHVRDYAHSRGVAIKGDIPIGISRTSVDAWTDTRLFNMDCQAGAPPDAFSVLGQNWGFPTYNWEEMSRDGFAWWKARFRKMSEYFDAYRIDHVLGFFRIWQIPMDALHGLLGIFNPALPYSPDEMRYNYDFWIDTDLQTKPYIMDWMLDDFFGPYTQEVRDTYLTPTASGRYALQPAYDTQRKVAEHFASLPDDEHNRRVRDGLMGLIDDVLFIEDPMERGKYHPRISAQHSYSYRALNDYERWCFDRLYNDFYYRRHNEFWYGKAMWKLPPLIDATDMLTCAEDLGMIPACVPAVMRDLEILVLEIQRMPKDPESHFGNTWSYPYFSVCTTSTHDMGGIRAWWEEDRAETQAYYNEVLHQDGAAPYFAEPWICEKIVDMHLKSPSMLCILPLQDWLSIDASLRRNDPRDEVINVPANPRHYWRYRMHINMEQLIADERFNRRLGAMISASGR